jgi:hypothetical protein
LTIGYEITGKLRKIGGAAVEKMVSRLRSHTCQTVPGDPVLSRKTAGFG